MTYMVKVGRKTHAPKRPIKTKQGLGKARTKRLNNHQKASNKGSSRKTISGTHRQQRSDTTYIFECTRIGCGYRIPREEKAEQGSLRFDLKCPKCHNREFKCLGKGDLPESLELPLPTTNIDFDNIRPVDLGSN